MIVGAGFAGLIAASMMPDQDIVDSLPEPTQAHKALLRFRTDAVANATGIEFRRVQVRKGIWHEGAFQQPNIMLANHYSHKVLNRLSPRSVWDVAPVQRFIAPEDFHERLLSALGTRIRWNTPAEFNRQEGTRRALISTAPLPVVAEEVGLKVGAAEFDRAPITVQRFSVPGADVHQTVYFPSLRHTLYRASITGEVLICEFADSHHEANYGAPVFWGDEVSDAFGINVEGLTTLEAVRQQYGKIAPIEEGVRRALVRRLTTDHNIYSLGRFATWRNILLDDVVQDVNVIKRLLRSSDYDISLRHA